MATDISILDNISVINTNLEQPKEELNLLDSLSVVAEDNENLPQPIDNKDELSLIQKTKNAIDNPTPTNTKWINALIQSQKNTVLGSGVTEGIELLSTIENSWNEGNLFELKKLIKNYKEDGIKETNWDTVDSKEVPPQLKKPEEEDFLDSLSTKVKYNISTADRLSYGWDKANFFGGHLWDLGKATIKSQFDKDKNLEDFALEETIRENKAFSEKHWKFADGKKDNDTLVQATELISHFLDPYWYAAYAYKPFRKVLGTYKGFMAHSGAVVGAYNWVEQMGTKGSVNKLELGLNVTGGVVFGGLTKGAFDTIAKIFPKATNKNLNAIISILNDKKAKFYGVSPKELNKLRAIANSKEVKIFNNEIGTNLKNLEALSTQSLKFIDRNKKLIFSQLKIKKLTKEANKLTAKVGNVGVKKIINKHKSKSLVNELANIEKKLLLNESNFAKLRDQLIKNGRIEYDKYAASVVKRNLLVLEKLAANENFLTSNIIRPILSYGTLPLVTSASGGALGIFFNALGNDGQNLKAWIISGAMVGATIRGMRASPKFSFATKDKILGIAASDNLKLAIQNARITFAATNATKLEGYGGATAKFGQIMLENIDSPAAGKSVVNVSEKWRMTKIKEISTIIGKQSIEEGELAMSIIQGNKDKTVLGNKRVVKLAKDIEGWLYRFQKDLNDVGIFTELEGISWQGVTKKGLSAKERKKFFTPKNYFPREYSQKIVTNQKEFAKDLFNIFKSLGATDSSAKALVKSYTNPNRNDGDKLLNRESIEKWLSSDKKKFNENFITTPLSKHISNERKLNGPYELVEKILMEKGYLNTNILSILTNMVSNTAKSYAFTKQFGPNGKFLEPLFAQIKNKYKNSNISGAWNDSWAGRRELDDVYGVIDGFFDSYHQKMSKANNFFTGMLSTGANTQMLSTVSIASMGDYVGSFVNSANAMAWVKSFPYLGRTTLGAASEWGPARNMNLHLMADIEDSLARGMAYNVKSKDSVLSTNSDAKSFFRISTWLGKPEEAYRFINKKVFQGIGLAWLTGNSRRFAYNTGAMDTWMQTRKLYKLMIKDGLAADNPKVINVYKWLDRLGIGMDDALKVGRFNTFDKSLENKLASNVLNEAGWLFANRDALIPQVSNRLLFTMSQNPYLRLLGQFQSWAMAKSSQTHKMIQRVENGDIRTFIKMMASVPIYSAIHQLRDEIKHGGSMQSAKYDMRDYLAYGLRLSGTAGWLSENIIGKFVGPGKKEWMPPGYAWGKNTIATLGEWIQVREMFGGTNAEREEVQEKFFKKVLPIPDWTAKIRGWWNRNNIVPFIPKENKKIKKSTGGIIKREGYEEGEEILIPKNKPILIPKKKPMKKKDLAAAVVATTLATTGVTADMDKAIANDIIPAKKTNVVIKKSYDNLPDLPLVKKEWLNNTAEKVYLTNNNNVIPNDILLSIASGETGWGSSGFLKRDSKNLFNFQSFDDKEESIAASQSKAKIKKFKTEEASIEQFLNWIETKESYAGVREEIKLFNEGSGSKANIIDAIAKTGFAEDKKWGVKIKSILNNRIDGKHKKELKDLANNLFKDTNDTKN